MALPAADAEPIADAGILIEDGVIAAIGPFSVLRSSYPLARERDATALAALPGLVDGHSHGRAIPLCEQGVREGPLELFLAQLTALTPLDPYRDAFVAGSDLLATGVTAVQVVFHSFAPFDEYLAAARSTIAGLAASGIEFELVAAFSDQHDYLPASVVGAPDGAEQLFDPPRGMGGSEFLQAFDTLAGSGVASVTIAPVAPQWCSEPVLAGIAARVRDGARIHTHLLESRAQRAALDPSPVETLRHHGLLGPWLSAAHAVWLSDAEIAEVADAGAVLVHCAGSNAKLAGGNAPVRRWLDAGVQAGLGLDSYARAEPPDAFDEMRAALTASRGALDARGVLGLATTGSAAALGHAGPGRLEPGSAASLVLVEPPDGSGDPVETLLAEATRYDVVEVWVCGGLRVEDGRLRGRREVELARADLRAELAADAAGRSRRLAEIAMLEPWLAEVWSLEPAAAGGPSERS
jgi:cytosine/adenosine deaminase-related metal-dependent hydrolase